MRHPSANRAPAAPIAQTGFPASTAGVMRDMTRLCDFYPPSTTCTEQADCNLQSRPCKSPKNHVDQHRNHQQIIIQPTQRLQWGPLSSHPSANPAGAAPVTQTRFPTSMPGAILFDLISTLQASPLQCNYNPNSNHCLANHQRNTSHKSHGKCVHIGYIGTI